MNFFKFLIFPLKSTEIPVGLRFQLASVTINFTNNRDYWEVLYSMLVSCDLANGHYSCTPEQRAQAVVQDVKAFAGGPASDSNLLIQNIYLK